MSVARWLWKSGKTKTGGGVPWNVQALNSDPDNFIWDKDKARTAVHLAAMYERGTTAECSRAEPSQQRDCKYESNHALQACLDVTRF
jgi:hypothetical protein